MQGTLEKIKIRLVDLIKECGNQEVQALAQNLSFGKMLRSKLLISIAGISEQSILTCALIEMIQSASLLHDDVIDEASMRRGQSSINALFGNKSAIMLGDVLYSKAFFELSKLDMTIAQRVSYAVTRLSIGEIEDVKLSESFHTNKERYIQMCADKTAALIVAAAECGAILADFELCRYSSYGENLGIAFQIVDDILDITQDSEILGKPSMNDFREGKSTLPYMFLYESLCLPDRERFLSYFGTNIGKSEEEWVKAKISECGGIAQSFKEAQKYAQKALLAIRGEGKPKLEEIIHQMIERTF